jgi:CheY-like chemotaxis protein
VTEIVLLEGDAAQADHVRGLLEAGGLSVVGAADPTRAGDALRGSRGGVLLARATTLAAHESWAGELRRTRPELEVVAPGDWGTALLEGARVPGLEGLARGALLLLAELCERHAGRPAVAARAARLAGLVALRMGLAPSRAAEAEQAAALAALGPHLVRFQLAAPQDPPPAGWGLSDGGQAALTAAALIGAPPRTREVLAALEERHDGGGRPRGLAGEAIPPEARAAAAALRWARLRAEQDEAPAAAGVAALSGGELDPRAVEALMRALRAESLTQGGPAGQATGARVLLADGDETSLALTELRLRQAGFAVEPHRDGVAACDAALAAPPDVLVADLALPRLDGVALLLRLRRQEQTARLPVLLLSARGDPATLQRALKLGARDILAKPLDHELLLAKLRALSGGKAAAGPALQGDLRELPLEEFFQALHLGRRTARVTIESRQGKGEVWFRDGDPVAALTSDQQGEPALLRILSWREGTYRLAAGEYPSSRNLDAPLQALLLRAAKARDDAERAG